jgi:hypothetical protein
MTKQVLRVRAAGTALVPDYEAQEDGVLRYVNRRRDPSLGHVDPKTKQPSGAWVPHDTHSEVPFRAEYLQELKAGTLLSADAETAKLAGVPFTVAAEVTNG